MWYLKFIRYNAVSEKLKVSQNINKPWKVSSHHFGTYRSDFS